MKLIETLTISNFNSSGTWHFHTVDRMMSENRPRYQLARVLQGLGYRSHLFAFDFYPEQIAAPVQPTLIQLPYTQGNAVKSFATPPTRDSFL
jgi:hypothetical protein